MHIIGIETQGLGTNNQMRGVVMSGAKQRKKGEKVPVSYLSSATLCGTVFTWLSIEGFKLKYRE